MQPVWLRSLHKNVCVEGAEPNWLLWRLLQESINHTKLFADWFRNGDVINQEKLIDLLVQNSLIEKYEVC